MTGKILREAASIEINFRLGMGTGLVAEFASRTLAGMITLVSGVFATVMRLFLHSLGFLLGLMIVGALTPRPCGSGPCTVAFMLGFISTSPLPVQEARNLINQLTGAVSSAVTPDDQAPPALSS